MNRMKEGARITFVIFILFTIIFTIIPTIVRADLKDTVAAMNPSMSIQEEYSNDPDLAPRNKIGDFITTAYLGFKLLPLDFGDKLVFPVFTVALFRAPSDSGDRHRNRENDIFAGFFLV